MSRSSSAQVRQHILDTAMPIMMEKGFTAVGLNELLAAAGIPKGSFYHYFGSKEAFGEALLESYYDEYLTRLEEILTRKSGTAASRLLSYWQDWMDRQSGDDPHAKCLTVKLGTEVCDLSEAMRASLQRGTSRIVARLARGIEAGLDDGSLVDIADPKHTASALYELWLGATLLAKVHRDGRALETAMAVTRQWLNQPARRRSSARA